MKKKGIRKIVISPLFKRKKQKQKLKDGML
jgi:hypothetical protein